MVFVVRLLINAIAIWVAAALVTGISIATDGRDTSAQVLIVLFIALVFTVVNTAIKPVVKLLSIPLLILTLGLFTLVINALMLLLTAWITDSTEFGLSIDGFWTAVWGSVIISIVNFLLGALVPDPRSRDRRQARQTLR
ncbi:MULTISPECIES: phage holin family protein [Actinomycetes]|uniref:phage holin family protein n=1 Tax=Actinomycetes TaxID=1760 RepID=UPI0004C272AA|nr:MULTISPECIES: phage holin family protein [Actinomycetes]